MEIPDKMPYSLEQILSVKEIDTEKIKTDYKKLIEWNAEVNQIKKCGNKIVNNYQFRELLKCKRDVKNYMTIYDCFNNNKEDDLWQQVIKRKSKNRTKYPLIREVWETQQINKGSISFFSPANAKYIYKKYNAKSVLDPTAGWGGRMLGATSLGIQYTGFDTNTNLREGYDKMIQDLELKNVNMIYQDCLSYDFSELNYDLVLTSPPYVNLELYENMNPFKSKDLFYQDFLIPLMDKCFQFLQEGGKMCFNIAPDMYEDLIKQGFRECDDKENLKQSLKSKKQRFDYIYIWEKNAVKSPE